MLCARPGCDAGESLSEIAADSGQSIDMIRKQFNVILGKSGVSRQAELLSLFVNARTL